MLHSKLVAGLAATTASLVFAAACTPDHVNRSASAMAQAAAARVAGGRPKLAIALQAPPAQPFPPLAVPSATQQAAAQQPLAQPSAEQLNAERPFVPAPIEAMRPFVLKADAADRARAVTCLAQAVYYEAAREPLSGQQAVAQVVLNRVRHPAYPKSVCGVVYQGAAKATGCQFTFTCDGSLRGRPQPALWARAEEVASHALAGYVDPDVGSATHYHAVYVDPYWAPTLVKMTQVGQHIFYRWHGAWGEPAAFTGHYDGHEAHLTPAVLKGGDARQPEDAGPTLHKVTLAVTGGVRTYTVADAAARGGERTRVAGVLQPSRRAPTAAEVQRINDDLASLDKRMQTQDVSTAARNAAVTAPTTGAVPVQTAAAAGPE